jgi:hypothetical protein
MPILQKDIKLLWGRAANRCSICRLELAQDKASASESFPLGEQAHIVAREPDGPRGHSVLSDSERDSYYNLILLCPTHHRIIDENVEDYPIEKLHMIKAQHELWVRQSLEVATAAQDKVRVTNEEAIAQFAKEWLAFYGFFFLFHTKISSDLDPTMPYRLDMDDEAKLLKEWHERTQRLRELLFVVGEKNLVVAMIHDWEELKERDEYIRKRGYETPFSYMLDFRAPVYAINNHGHSLWIANQISLEYLEYLSYTSDRVKQIVN